jgi:hypothetical protein
MSDKTTSQQLDDAIKAVEAASAKVEELKKLTREEDLKTVLALIKRHDFSATDLKSALKVRAVKTASTGKRPYNKKTAK